MKKSDPLLTIRFDGKAMGPGRIPVAHLIGFLTDLNKALQRTGRALSGDGDSVRRGRMPANINDEIALDLVLLTEGSPAAVLGFERRKTAPALPDMDFGMEILEKSISGLAAAQNGKPELPTGFDSGVLMAWRDAGKLFEKDVSKITMTLRGAGKPVVTRFTPEGFARLRERIQGPHTNIRTIEGRLLMADFKEQGTRCRVHPSAGEPILCLFDDEKKEEILEDILQYVRVVGEASQDASTGKIKSITIHDIERIEDIEGTAADLLPQGTPLSRSFWESPSLDELAAAQGVGPVTDARSLYGTWPGDADDDFEQLIDELRHADAGTRGRG